MRMQNIDDSGWSVVIAVDDDGHLTICASHENGNGYIDITDDVFEWETEFGVRLAIRPVEGK